MNTTNKTICYFYAIFTIFVWGITFISTKVLIEHSLTPIEILVYRFGIAYLGIWLFGRRRLFSANAADELLCILLGLGGGSLYFWFENTALQITQASDVSLLVSTSPILTAFALRISFGKSMRISNRLITGSLIALVGVALVVFNGSYILQLKPLGYLYSILAAASWAVYGVALRKLSAKYDSIFITRKVFFYGIITILPLAIVEGNAFHPAQLASVPVILNLLFLALIGSLLCYIMWNIATKVIGMVRITNFIYFIPIVTMLFSPLLKNEKITIMAIVGTVACIFGVYWAEKKSYH